MVKVTLDIFSGVPNPTWELTEAEAAAFMDRYRSNAVAATTDVETSGGLGFRGFLIHSDSSDADMPEVIRVGAPAVTASNQTADAAPADAADTENFLLQSAKGAVDDELASFVSHQIELSRTIVFPPICLVQEPAYNPAFWNTPQVQPRNNCYNYAMNYRSDTFAQPGRKTGHMYTALTCPSVSNGALSDGNTTACRGRTKHVALVIWPGRDFHWYAHHPQGFWGHKPGQTAVRNVDNRGRVIGGTLNPQNCDRGPYTQFCSYLYSPVGIVVS